MTDKEAYDYLSLTVYDQREPDRFLDCIALGVSALRDRIERSDGWKNVNIEPPHGTPVLTYTPDAAIPVMVDVYDGYIDYGIWHDGWVFRGRKYAPTHWCYLPQPPNGNDKEKYDNLKKDVTKED